MVKIWAKEVNFGGMRLGRLSPFCVQYSIWLLWLQHVVTMVTVLIQIKTLPMLLVNAKDDPLVWEELLTIPADYTSKSCLHSQQQLIV